jgi:hypothetical protein
VIIGEITFQNPQQMPYVQNNDMIRTISPDRANQSFRERILPKTTRCREDFLDAQVIQTAADFFPVDPLRQLKAKQKAPWFENEILGFERNLEGPSRTPRRTRGFKDGEATFLCQDHWFTPMSMDER